MGSLFFEVFFLRSFFCKTLTISVYFLNKIIYIYIIYIYK